jgi:hypothetical protein
VNNTPQIRAQVISRGTSEEEATGRLESIVSMLRQEIAKLGGTIVS